MRTLTPLILIAVATNALPGCSSMYYGTMESLGVPKRQILSDRVGKARAEQEDAKETFEDALEQFRSVVSSEPGELENKYRQLKTQLERCEAQADDVADRIKAIEKVARALFEEWESEMDGYQSDSMRRTAEKQMRDTRERYDQLMAAMNRAEDKMQPVLGAFREQVLFMKHNLNAAAIASLQGEVVAIERNVAELIAEMEQAIAEADKFIAETQS